MHGMRFEEKKQALQELGVLFDKPKTPTFSTLVSRVKSFSKWRHNQSPESMARAGFFFTGPRDRVRCFFCGNGLEDWEESDDPWVEHAKVAPQCPFLILNKGRSFTSGDHQIATQLASQQDTRNSLETPVLQKYREERGVVSVPSSPECSLQSTAAIKALQLGYSELDVRKAVNVLKTRNLLTFSLTELVEVILDLRTSDSGYGSLEELRGEDNFGDTDRTESLPESGKSVVKDGEYSIETDGTSCDSQSNSGNVHESIAVSERRATKNQSNEIVTCDSGYDSCGDEESEDVGNLSESEKLVAENEHLRDILICKVCNEEQVSVIFLPCTHLCTCSECYRAVKKCPICNSQVKAIVRAYLV